MLSPFNRLKNIFLKPEEPLDNTKESLTAKEKQTAFIKTYLKPALKQNGYLTSGQTWWKSRDHLITFVNLQNFSWNTKDDVNFCFNIGIALKPNIKNPAKPNFIDSSIQLRESSFLPQLRDKHLYRNENGYHILASTPLEALIAEAQIDFEQHLLSALEQLDTPAKCVTYFENFVFWGERFKNDVIEAQLL